MDLKLIGLLSIPVVLILGITFFFYLISSGKMFSESGVETWTTSEAIFYGAVVIALSNLWSK